MSLQRSPVNRPVRTAGVLFAGMTILCAACAPFALKVDLLLFIVTCSAYSLFLAIFVVGLALVLPGRTVHWWFLSGAVPVLSLVGFWLLVRNDPETFLQMTPGAIYALQSVIGVWLAVGLVVAGLGWVRYFRWAVQQNHQ